ncbi:MAG: cytochrome c-type biogenesis protein CcmH [Alphaproteobacteria bacterium]|nr:cytochrome c-type biogenesis protein CcmH [Alphaproteobacteria bacterium]
MNKLFPYMLALMLACSAHAFTPEPALSDATQEAIAQRSFHQLRCVVCDGQSLAESDATLAIQMRSEIRAMAKDGQAEKVILAYFKQRYGDSILMTPPLNPHTYALWGAPLLLLLVGLALLWRKR